MLTEHIDNLFIFVINRNRRCFSTDIFHNFLIVRFYFYLIHTILHRPGSNSTYIDQC